MFVDGLQCHFQNETVALHQGVVVAGGVVELAGVGVDGVVIKVPPFAEFPFGLARMCFVLMDASVVGGSGRAQQTVLVAPIDGIL